MMPKNKNKAVRVNEKVTFNTQNVYRCSKTVGLTHTHTHSLFFSDTLNPSFHEDNISKCLLGLSCQQSFGHTRFFFYTPSVQSKDRLVWGCVYMCHCLVKQVKNVSGDDPFLPQAHLGIFVAASTFLPLFFTFCSDGSDSSGWLAWVFRETAFLCVCIHVYRWTWHHQKT